MTKIYLIIIAFFLSNILFSQNEPTYKTDEIIITSNKTSTAFLESTRSISSINKEEIKLLPVSSLSDLLEFTTGVDIKQRGPQNVQSDLSIRGGSFEQTLVLINGIKISDSQTGHHNMNLPVSLYDIEKIEILKGQGSSIHGANAFSGVVNIITKSNKEQSLSLNSSVGSNGYYDTYLGFSQPFGILKNNFSISKSHSNGYRYNTGFNNLNISYTPKLLFGKNSISLFTGYQKKEFGSNGFYSDKYPNQWEETKTLLTSLKGDFVFDNLFLSPKFSWRKHDDMYLLDHERPSFYKNTHVNNSYNAEVETIYHSAYGFTALSFEFGIDKIESSNLDNHERNKAGVSIEHKTNLFSILDLSIGGYLYKYDQWGWKLCPNADLGLQISQDFRLYASIGNSFRIPTFTELYYTSPAQIGNSSLKPEEALSYEAGIKYITENINSSVSFFARNGKNLIDWSKQNTQDKWTANNIADLNTNGVEVNFSFLPQSLFIKSPITKISLGYSYLETDDSKINYISRYVLDNLRHQAIATIHHQLVFDIQQSWNIKYEYRYNSSDYFLWDTKISRQINFVNLSVSINNLFNRAYTDFTNLPMPGRWIIGTVKLNFNQI
ncbi:MAG: TonB-dependent receptor [bacterium]